MKLAVFLVAIVSLTFAGVSWAEPSKEVANPTTEETTPENPLDLEMETEEPAPETTAEESVEVPPDTPESEETAPPTEEPPTGEISEPTATEEGEPTTDEAAAESATPEEGEPTTDEAAAESATPEEGETTTEEAAAESATPEEGETTTEEAAAESATPEEGETTTDEAAQEITPEGETTETPPYEKAEEIEATASYQEGPAKEDRPPNASRLGEVQEEIDYQELSLALRPGLAHVLSGPGGANKNNFTIEAHVQYFLLPRIALNVPYMFTRFGSNLEAHRFGGGPLVRYLDYKFLRGEVDANLLYARFLGKNHLAWSLGVDITAGLKHRTLRPFLGPFFRYERIHVSGKDLSAFSVGVGLTLTNPADLE